jgi:hypothetical protein
VRLGFVPCSSCSCSPFVSIRRNFGFRLDGVSDGPQQGADSPRVPGGQSACSPRTVRGAGALLLVLCVFNGRSEGKAERSAVAGRTVRAAHRGRSALSGRTVRQRQRALLFWFDSSPSSFVLPRVLQGIVPKARGCSITSLSWRLVCDSIHRSCVTGICLGHRSGSLRRIFTGSYSLPPL